MNWSALKNIYLAAAFLLTISSANSTVFGQNQQRVEKPLGYSLGISVIGGLSQTSGKAHRVTAISPNSPANGAGLLPGDFILSINKIRTGETRTLADLIQNSDGNVMQLVVEREGKQKTLLVKPVTSATEIVESKFASSSKNSEGGETKVDKAKNVEPTDMNNLGDNVLFDNVTIRHIEELGVLSIRGQKADVEKVEKAIRKFIKSANLFSPRNQVFRLKNTWANQAAESITEVYENQFASREGTVSITPMHNPEALMVIGRQGAIDIVRTLAKAYDSGQLEGK